MNALKRRFRITHPFHPRTGEEFALITYCRSWGQREAVEGEDADGRHVTLPLEWTDAAQVDDPFLVRSVGRSCFRVEDLLRLAELLGGLAPGSAGDGTGRS